MDLTDNSTAEGRVRLVVDNPTPDDVGAPVPGAMAVLALTACLVTMVLGVCRAFGAVDWSVAWLLAPLWGSAILIALVAAGAAAVASAREGK